MVTTITSELKLMCPSRVDDKKTLIIERIDAQKCEQRQSENFHKCTYCKHKGCS